MLKVLLISAAACQVTDWNTQERADMIYMTGATTCPSGWLHYQVRDLETDEFIISGEALIRGYAFQEFASAPHPGRPLNLHYTISEF